MNQGFEESQKTKLDILTESAIKYCQERSPEKLNSIFDYHSPQFNRQICDRIIAVLDINTIAWFCGYLCSEINHSSDNNKSYAIGKLSAVLISQGMQIFEDFTPYPGQRLIIANLEKFRAFPQEIQNQVSEFFEVQEKTSEEILADQ